VIHGEIEVVNPAGIGARACVHDAETIAAGASRVWRFRLAPHLDDALADVDAIVAARKAEADEFYDTVHPPRANADERLVQRQALAGLLWTKQIHLFDPSVDRPLHARRRGRRRIFGEVRRFQDDPYWRDCLLFPEYFHGDTGAGLGAMHQTGWTGLVANLIDEWRR
jgi:hypothetical protein